MERLEPVDQDDGLRITHYRDVYTGQLWQGVAWDIGSYAAGNEILSPISKIDRAASWEEKAGK